MSAPTEPVPRKVVLATFGTLGDIYPFIAVALAVRRRGLSPTLVAPDAYRTAIEAEGLVHAPLRPNIEDVASALGTDIPGAFVIMLRNPHFILDEIYMRFLAETYEDVARACAGASVVLTHSLQVGATLAAETSGLPRARLALAPLHLQSAVAPALTPGAPYIAEPRSFVTRRYNRAIRAAVRASVDLRTRRLRAFRREIGLARSREDLFLDFGRANGADAIFGLYSPLFAPAQPDQPGNLIVPGFPFYRPADDERRDLVPELRSFLETGDPPVVFTLGSFAPQVSGDFYDRSIRAARSLGLRAVVLAGARDADRIAGLAGEREHVCAQAPHGLLFPRACCVVHHGGIGTTAECLRAGRPQIVVPFFGDQPDHGARIARLGLGLSIALRDYDEGVAGGALRTVLDGGHAARAERFATMVREEAGVEPVADWVERQL